MRTCTNCDALLIPGESSPCLDCAVKLAKGREQHGGGERHCVDCFDVWTVEFDENDNAINADECPGCGSDAVEPMSKAHERALREETRREGGF